MVAEALDISRETYFAILMDRACNGPVMVGSPQGGMDIEEVAAKNPELIFKVFKLVLFFSIWDDEISEVLTLPFANVVLFLKPCQGRVV